MITWTCVTYCTLFIFVMNDSILFLISSVSIFISFSIFENGMQNHKSHWDTKTFWRLNILTKQPSKIVINYNYLNYFDIISYLQQISKKKNGAAVSVKILQNLKRDLLLVNHFQISLVAFRRLLSGYNISKWTGYQIDL